MRRYILCLALPLLVGSTRADVLSYTLTGSVSGLSDPTGAYGGEVHEGDAFVLTCLIDTNVPALGTSQFGNDYAFKGPTTATAGSYSHNVTNDASQRPFGDFLSLANPLPDPYEYVFEGQESLGTFTMKDGTTASLGSINIVGFLDDPTRTAFTVFTPPTSIDVNLFSKRALEFNTQIFDHETDVTDPVTGQLVSTPFYKNDLIVASLDSVHVNAVPEPCTLAALGLGLASVARRKRRG